MKLPTSVNILGTKIKIFYSKLPLEHDGNRVFGLYDPNDNRIYIDGTQRKEFQLEILYHELGHAVFDLSSLNVTSIEEDIQEVIVDQFAKFIFANFSFKK